MRSGSCRLLCPDHQQYHQQGQPARAGAPAGAGARMHIAGEDCMSVRGPAGADGDCLATFALPKLELNTSHSLPEVWCYSVRVVFRSFLVN